MKNHRLREQPRKKPDESFDTDSIDIFEIDEFKDDKSIENKEDFEKKIEDLTKRVELTRELLSSLTHFSDEYEFPHNLEESELRKILDDKIEAIENRFPKDLVGEYENIKEQLESNKKDTDYNLEKIYENPDLEFLYSIDQIKEDLIEKYKKVNDIAFSNEYGSEIAEKPYDERLDSVIEVLQDKYKQLEDQFLRENITDISDTSFSIIIDVKGVFFEKIGLDKSNTGLDLQNSPISIIREDLNYTLHEETAKHEEKHNLLAGATKSFNIRKGEITNLSQHLKQFEISLKKEDLESAYNILNTIEENINSISTENLLDREHEEIVAEFHVFFKKIVELDLMKGGEFNSHSFGKLTSILSTAGLGLEDELEYIDKRIEVFEKIINEYSFKTDGSQEINPSELIDDLKTKKEDFKKGVINSVKNIKDNLTVGIILGQEAEELVESSLMILKPSNYGYIENILENKFGKKEVKSAQEKYYKLSNFLDQVDNRSFDENKRQLKELNDAFSQDDRIPEPYINNLEKVVIRIVGETDLEKIDLNTLEDLIKEYKNLSSKIGVDQNESVVSLIRESFFEGIIKKSKEKKKSHASFSIKDLTKDQIRDLKYALINHNTKDFLDNIAKGNSGLLDFLIDVGIFEKSDMGLNRRELETKLWEFTGEI